MLRIFIYHSHEYITYPAPNLLKSLLDCRVYTVKPRNTAVVSMNACRTIYMSYKVTVKLKKHWLKTHLNTLNFKQRFPLAFSRNAVFSSVLLANKNSRRFTQPWIKVKPHPCCNKQAPKYSFIRNKRLHKYEVKETTGELWRGYVV